MLVHGQDGDLVIGGPAASEIGAASTAGTQDLTAADAHKTDGTCARKQGAGVDYSKWNSFGQGESDSDEDHQVKCAPRSLSVTCASVIQGPCPLPGAPWHRGLLRTVPACAYATR